ncbi:uncharacterized protein A4U43_C01F20110 [Asparagus officinalis]|uniref:Bifunctional inhibitor/plant lipid transfer protein/seed storage helical domain-containing protein n=1 Tax=Asparagus officinalis TaxID=4686 RepID=A0A5P1FRD5_ASPOF|nr:protein YLS3-like [Asparagus officinalis]ONK80642.1 uncharacterized protein A4U43_C01F20110 [Asparagus officinalis]
MPISTIFSILLLILSSSITCNATIADDEKDCADQLQNLAACIPYVSGAAKKPTPECCADAEKVRSSKPKCLCVLIVESADPSLALPINTTLALRMPAACDSDAKVSDCPDILKLSHDSQDAKIFKDPSGDSSRAIAPASSYTAAASSNSTPASADAKIASKNNAGRLQSVFLLTVSIASTSCNLLFY